MRKMKTTPGISRLLGTGLFVLACAAAGRAAGPWSVLQTTPGQDVKVRKEATDAFRAGDVVEIYFVIEPINEKARKATGRIVRVEREAFYVALDADSVSAPIAGGDLVALIEKAPAPVTPSPELPPPPPALVQPAHPGPITPAPPEEGYLGVVLQDDPLGVMVRHVAPDTAASRAGFLAGDIIYGYRGGRIADVAHFKQLVDEAGVDSAARFQVLRAGIEIVLTAVLGDLPDEPPTIALPPVQPEPPVFTPPQPPPPAVPPAPPPGREPQYQEYFTAGSTDDVRAGIQRRWDAGQRITAVTHGTRAWFLTATAATDIDQQQWLLGSYSYVNSEIRKYRQQGKEVTAIHYNGVKWLAVLSTGTPLYGQKYLSRPLLRDLGDEIKAHWDRGYHVTAVSHGPAGWFVVFSKGTGYRAQSYVWRRSFGEIKQAIEQKWGEGYHVTDILVDKGVWLAVFSKGAGYTAQAWASRSDFNAFRAEIKNRWSQGYRITSTTYENRTWFGVFSKGHIRW